VNFSIDRRTVISHSWCIERPA